MMNRVLITGAAGGIGSALRETLRGVYPMLRVSDKAPLAPARDGEEAVHADISDMAQVERIVAGCDGTLKSFVCASAGRALANPNSTRITKAPATRRSVSVTLRSPPLGRTLHPYERR